MAEQSAAEVRRVAAEFEQLAASRTKLGQHVRMAQALASRDPAAWRQMQPKTWAALITRLCRWAEVRMVAATDVKAPGAIRARLEDELRYPYTRGAVRLTAPQLAAWLAPGIEGAAVRAAGAFVGMTGGDGAMRPH